MHHDVNGIVRIAHRAGGVGIYENKIETIKRALRCDFIDAIEVDVRKTKDDVLVLSHARGVKTNGKRVWIDRTPFKDIQHLGIATLDEILPLFKESDKILDLDIKDRGTARALKEVIKKNTYFKKIYISSFDLRLLFEIQEVLPHGSYFLSSNIKDSRDFSQQRVFRAFLIFAFIFLSRFAVFFLKRKYKKIKLDGISLFYRFASRGFIDYLKRFGLKVLVWGTDKEKDIKKMTHFNIDGIKLKNIKLFKKLPSK